MGQIPLNQLLVHLLIWSLVGIVVFNLYVVVVFRTGIVYTSREQDGTLKGRLPLSGVLSSLSILVGIIAVQLASSFSLLSTQTAPVNFWVLLALNYSLFLVLFLYDTLVIDYFVIGRWRPAILHLPDEMDAGSMTEHIRASLVVAPLIGLVLSLVSTLITRVWF
jgi:hypothetical protein